MHKHMLLMLLMGCVFLLSCSRQEEPASNLIEGMDVNGVQYCIHLEKQTAKIAENEFSYSLTGDYEAYNLSVIGPNKERIEFQGGESGSAGRFGDGIDFKILDQVHILENVLVENVLKPSQSSHNFGSIIVGVFFIGIGILYAINPRFVFDISEGWRYKNLEPSDLALTINRVIGIVIIVIGIIVIFI